MNFMFFSTTTSQPAVGKNVQNRHTASFSGFFKRAILKFQ